MSLPCMDTHSLLPSSIATPLDIAYASAHYDLSTYYIHELAEACFTTPLSSLDHTASAPASCRKRRAMSDVALELTQFNDGCELNDEVISLDAHSLPQLIHTPNDNHTPNPPTFKAPPHKFSDLEDVLDLLWMQDDTASTTQSASSPVAAASSDHISLISDLDWDYGTNESSSNQGESNDNPSSDNLQSLEVNQEGVLGASSKKEGSLNFNWERSFQNKEEADGNGIWGGLQHQRVEVTRGSWQGGGGARGSWQKQGGESASWQEKKQGEIRASWQDEIRASWQDKIRASWQPEGKTRASWQEKKEEGGQNRASWQGQGGLRCKQEERVEGAASVSEKQSTVDALVRSPRSGAWAGPTLFDIESALALNSASPCTTSPSLSSFSPLASPSTPKHHIPPFFDVKKLLSDDLFKASGQYDSLDSSWRLKLQKRNSLEPKYTIKVESEEKALGDGYRWRKYGQKSIKNSPFPRSYYRCSTGKCKAKKQVEKCHEDTRVFVVTYEGIHLHHRPNPSHKFRTLGGLHEDEKEKCASHLCSPSSSASCSYSIPPLCSSSSNHTLLT